jgi:site-specific DNA-methyltransferase (adenine-specific)
MSEGQRTLPRNQILVGDARQVLDTLPDSSIDTVVTSPPYFRLRNYQHDSQIGLEEGVERYADDLRLVARGLARALKPTGTLWLNLGDTYARSDTDGAPPKSLLLAPERVALKLIADGWILRNKIVWAKPNPMPTSVRDRLSCTWEVVYCFARSRTYFFDLDAIREPHRSGRRTATAKQVTRAWAVPEDWRAPLAGSNGGLDHLKASGLPGHPLGKNPGDVWLVPTAGYRGAHHAVYPEALIRRPLLVGCPERVCADCGTPWHRPPHATVNGQAIRAQVRPDCVCLDADSRPGLVLDPFMGSGTTALVAQRLGRDWLGIELNPDFAAQADRRVAAGSTLTIDADRPG